MRTLIVGDIHGAHKALEQCLERSKFDRDNDTLICLGDVCDGWPFVKECVEILQSIPKFIGLIGNHDEWAMNWARNGVVEGIWHGQGGEQTLKSFNNDRKSFPLKWFDSLSYIAASGKQLFVHAGIDPNQREIRKQDHQTCIWSRELVWSAFKKYPSRPDLKFGGWDDIFVGHTITQTFKSNEPLNLCNIWMLDTGCGWGHKLSIMDIDTKEYFQSDNTRDLYLGIKGRA